jgi:hypothetical protein
MESISIIGFVDGLAGVTNGTKRSGMPLSTTANRTLLFKQTTKPKNSSNNIQSDTQIKTKKKRQRSRSLDSLTLFVCVCVCVCDDRRFIFFSSKFPIDLWLLSLEDIQPVTKT